MAIKWADLLKNSQSEVSGPAADIEHGIPGTQLHCRHLSHQLKNESCINGGLLAGFKTAESFHIMVESRAYFGGR